MEQNPDPQEAAPSADPSSAAEASEPTLNADKLNELMAGLKAKENIVMAVVAGVVSALVGAGIWAAVTVATEYQIGWMAVGVGFLCGFAVRYMGKGVSPHFGYVGAVSALLGCLVGNFFTIVGFGSKQLSVGFFELLGVMDYALVPEMMQETFEPIDLLFYGIAVYGGYKASFVQLTEEQIHSCIE